MKESGTASAQDTAQFAPVSTDSIVSMGSLLYILASLVALAFVGTLFLRASDQRKESQISKVACPTDRQLFKNEVGGDSQKSRKRQAKERLVPKFDVIENNQA